MNTVSVDVSEYDALLYDSGFLQCLRYVGVEDWEGYKLACDAYHEGAANVK